MLCYVVVAGSRVCFRRRETTRLQTGCVMVGAMRRARLKGSDLVYYKSCSSKFGYCDDCSAYATIVRRFQEQRHHREVRLYGVILVNGLYLHRLGRETARWVLATATIAPAPDAGIQINHQPGRWTIEESSPKP